MSDSTTSNEIPNEDRCLGRAYSHDPRDAGYPMRAMLLGDTPLKTKYWRSGVALDQGPTSQCVGFSWHQFCASAPIMTKGAPPPSVIYEEAKKIDEWIGEDYEGTSVRAGVKVLHRLGRIKEYRWSWEATEVRTCLLTRGTVVVGTNWYKGMFTPDKNGFIFPTGPVAGGHAYVIVGYDVKRNAFRILNSWGPKWGQKGRAWIRFEDMDRLLRENGEACSAIENKV